MFKKYKPSKYLSYLYFFIPVLLSTMIIIVKERDIWFILSYGRYILKNGFPHNDILSMHSNFSLVVQQWLSDIIYYLSYKVLGGVGIYLIVFIVNCLILYFLYKLCMKISSNKIFNSVITASVTDILLQTYFITSRPQIFTFLIFILLIYILEIYREEDSKSIYLLPLLSLLLINLHASMWLCFFIFSMPFVAEFLFKKDKKIIKLIILLIISFLVGFINPYGINSMTYALSSYGIKAINETVMEMSPFTLSGVLSPAYYVLLITFFGLNIYMSVKKKASIHQVLLIFGTFYMALRNFRNLSFFCICALPFYSNYLPFENSDIKDDKRKYSKYFIITSTAIIIILIANIATGSYTLKNPHQKAIDYLNKNATKDIKLYANNDNGSYYVFDGYHPYMDGRVEVFVKANNKKYDVMNECYKLDQGKLKPEKFLAKYNFDYLVVSNKETLYYYLKDNKSYEKILKVENSYLYKKK